jgi:hypothetical protein
MMPFSMIGGGQFNVTVSGGVASAVNVEVPGMKLPDLIVCRAITGWGELNDAQSIMWWKDRSSANGVAKGLLQSSHASAPAVTSLSLSSGGISVFDTANPPTYAGLATTAITGTAGTFVVTMANTGSIAIGDHVRLYGTTGELQIAGYTFQVTAVTTNVSITLGYMASSGMTFAADATAGTVVKYIPSKMYPRWAYIANITRATQAVVSFTELNDFTVGEVISLRIPADFGSGAWTSINNQPARVLSVTNSATVSSITLDLDTSGIASAFSFPTSAVAAAGVSPSVVVPSSDSVIPENGSATTPQEPPGMNLRAAADNRNKYIVQFGAGLFNVSSFVSDNNDSWCWEAYKFDNYSTATVTL